MATINIAATAAITIPAIGPPPRCVFEADLACGALVATGMAVDETGAIEFELEPVEDAESVLVGIDGKALNVVGPVDGAPSTGVLEAENVDDDDEVALVDVETVTFGVLARAGKAKTGKEAILP
jgi:hypothetical protein